MSWIMDGNNFNQRGVVHNPQDAICRTIIGGGGQGGYTYLYVVRETSDKGRMDLH